jgi:hypothetical protein
MYDYNVVGDECDTVELFRDGERGEELIATLVGDDSEAFLDEVGTLIDALGYTSMSDIIEHPEIQRFIHDCINSFQKYGELVSYIPQKGE